jgi:magnesium transporter
MQLFKRSSRKAGQSPGTLTHIGEKKLEKATIEVIDYDSQNLEEIYDTSPEECLPYKGSSTVTWIDVTGVHDVQVVEQMGKAFALHPLLLEDVVHTAQRPKMEDFGEYLFFVLNMLTYDAGSKGILSEQISLVLGPSFVISFQESEGDVFNPVRERIRNAKGRIRKMGSDYLAYALIDAVVDHYFIILESISEKIEALQEEVLSQPSPETLQIIQTNKQDLIYLRKSVWPLREAVNNMQRTESDLITDGVLVFLRDVYDHTIQVIDTVETFRDMNSGTLDIYLSSVSNRMNEVMKVLTIIATIFIPLTFLAGIYGMNFEYMPELKWRGAYFVVWLIMLIVGIIMFIGFKRKKWL